MRAERPNRDVWLWGLIIGLIPILLVLYPLSVVPVTRRSSSGYLPKTTWRVYVPLRRAWSAIMPSLQEPLLGYEHAAWLRYISQREAMEKLMEASP